MAAALPAADISQRAGALATELAILGRAFPLTADAAPVVVNPAPTAPVAAQSGAVNPIENYQ